MAGLRALLALDTADEKGADLAVAVCAPGGGWARHRLLCSGLEVFERLQDFVGGSLALLRRRAPHAVGDVSVIAYVCRDPGPAEPENREAAAALHALGFVLPAAGPVVLLGLRDADDASLPEPVFQALGLAGAA